MQVQSGGMTAPVDLVAGPQMIAGQDNTGHLAPVAPVLLFGGRNALGRMAST
jgi:hypothetical protein